MFNIKPTKNKEYTGYKTIYIKEKLIQEINKIDIKNDTSFNNVVISMIIYCLEEQRK